MPKDDNTFVDAEFEVVEEEAEIPALSGICHQCLGSDYVHVSRNGVLGVLYTSVGNNPQGREQKRLVTCTHGASFGI